VWKEHEKSYTFYLKSRIDDNLKPVITKITSSNKKLSIGEDFTLNYRKAEGFIEWVFG